MPKSADGTSTAITFGNDFSLNVEGLGTGWSYTEAPGSGLTLTFSDDTTAAPEPASVFLLLCAAPLVLRRIVRTITLHETCRGAMPTRFAAHGPSGMIVHRLRRAIVARNGGALTIASGETMNPVDPDIAKVFTDSKSVNRALRLLLDLARNQLPHDWAA